MTPSSWISRPAGRDGLRACLRSGAARDGHLLLVLTARSQLHEDREGSNAGADDYLTQAVPGAPAAWPGVQGLVRRAAGNASSILEIGECSLDMAASQVWYEGTPSSSPPTRFRVLGYLMQHRARCCRAAS